MKIIIGKDLLIDKKKAEYIQLQQALKLCGAVRTGGEAKEFIKLGKCKVGGEICTQRGKKLYEGDFFEY